MVNRRIENILEAGNTGVISDLPPSRSPIDSWSEANNVRFRDGQVSKIGGFQPVIANGHDGTVIRKAIEFDDRWFYVESPNPDDNAATATSDIIYSTLGGAHDVVHDFGDLVATVHNSKWSMEVVEGALYVNNPTHEPLGLPSGATSFVPLQGWNNKTCEILIGYRSFILAMNLVESGQPFQHRIRWSARVEPNSLPNDWPANNYVDLPGATGAIVSVKPLGDSLLIYTANEVFRMSFTGGQTVFRIERVYSGAGSAYPKGVAEFDNKHFVVSKNDVFVTTGTSRQSIAANKVSKELSSRLRTSNPNAVQTMVNYFKNEVWLFYNESKSSLLATKAAVWNWYNGSWTYMDCPPIADITLVSELTPDVRDWKYYDTKALQDPSTPTDWIGQVDTWSGVANTYVAQLFVGGATNGVFFALDTESTVNIFPDGRTQPVSAKLVKNNYDIHRSEPIPSNHVRITAMYPHFDGSGAPLLQIQTSDLPEGVNSYGSEAFFFTVGTDYKRNTRLFGRYITFEIKDNGSKNWTYFGTDVDCKTGGSR